MKTKARQEALRLRRQGKSVRAIANELAVSTGSVSRWCIGIKLSEEQRSLLDSAQRRLAAQTLAPFIMERKNGKIRDIANQHIQAKKDIGTHTRRDLLILGLGLYWGEGYKRGSEEWGFTNSDSSIVRTVLVWLDKCYGVDRSRIIARLTINAVYKSHATAITRWWSKEIKVPMAQFGTPSFVRSQTASKLDGRLYRGTLRIKVRNGTSLRRRVLASIATLADQIAPSSRSARS